MKRLIVAIAPNGGIDFENNWIFDRVYFDITENWAHWSPP